MNPIPLFQKSSRINSGGIRYATPALLGLERRIERKLASHDQAIAGILKLMTPAGIATATDRV